MVKVFPRSIVMLLVLLLFVANTINLGADLAAMGAAAKLVLGGSARLYTLACRMAGSPEDGEDLLQEIFIALWQALPRFRGESTVWTFTFRVAHNRAVSFAARTE